MVALCLRWAGIKLTEPSGKPGPSFHGRKESQAFLEQQLPRTPWSSCARSWGQMGASHRPPSVPLSTSYFEAINIPHHSHVKSKYIIR
jgi:hypothetical protein